VEDADDVHALSLLRFLGRFAVDLVRASLQVALIVLRPRYELRQAVLAVPVRAPPTGCSRCSRTPSA
jgi:multisubunit Na+/H+ antiporter MnhE subunit